MTKSILSRIIFYSFALFFLILPAVFWLGFESIFSVAKMLLVVFFTDFLLLCVMIYWHSEREIAVAKPTTWQKYNWIFLSSAFLSTIFSANFFSSFFGTTDIFLGLLTLVHIVALGWIFSSFFPKEKVPTLLYSMFVGAFFVALYSIFQFYGYIKFADISWTQNPGSRAFGTLGHPNHLAAYMAFNLATGFGLLFHCKLKWKKILLIAGGLLMFWALLLAGSRGAFLAIIIALLVQIFILFRKRKNKSIKKIIVGCILFVVVAITASPLLVQTPLFNRIEKSVKTENVISGSDRLSWWKSGFDIFIDNPVFGSGLSTFPDVYNEYRRLDYRVLGDLQDTTTPESAHNEIVNTLATQGVFGLFAMIMLFGYPLRLIALRFKDKKLKEKDKYLLIALSGGIVTCLIQVQFNFWVVSTFAVFYFALSAVCLLCEKQIPQTLKIKTGLFRWVLYVFFILILCSLALNYYRLKAEYFIQKGDSAIFAQDKEKYYAKGVLSFPWDYNYSVKYADYALGSIMANRPDADFSKYIHLSISYYKDALKINDHRPVVWGNYAVSLLTFSNYQSALGDEKLKYENQQLGIEAFEVAIKKAKNNPFFNYHFAMALEKVGLNDGALEQYKTTLKIRPNYLDAQSRLEKLTLS